VAHFRSDSPQLAFNFRHDCERAVASPERRGLDHVKVIKAFTITADLGLRNRFNNFSWSSFSTWACVSAAAQHLVEIDIADCNVGSWQGISSFAKLQRLRVTRSYSLLRLPPEFAELTQLQVFDFRLPPGARQMPLVYPPEAVYQLGAVALVDHIRADVERTAASKVPPRHLETQEDWLARRTREVNARLKEEEEGGSGDGNGKADELYVWGANGADVEAAPRLTRWLDTGAANGVNVAQIACGLAHVVVLSDVGIVYARGCACCLIPHPPSCTS